MISYLDRKLFRDLSRMKGQAVAVSVVMGCGLAMLIMSRSLILSLEKTRREYYESNRFAQVFASLKRAPRSLTAQLSQIPGVAHVQPGVAAQVTLDIPGLNEPASGMALSLPDFTEPELNRLYLRAGSWLTPGGRGQVLVGEAFADANQLRPGDTVAMLLHGRRQVFRIAGIVLSPEYIFESRPGAALPDNRTYGVFWLPYEELSKAFELYGAFNALALSLTPGTSERSVIDAIDRLLQPFGGRGAYSRADHPSHIRVSDEIRVLQTLSIGFPVVFLSVAAFMTNSVLARLLSLQREQIAILKAFGFPGRSIVWHYLKFAFVLVVGGVLLGWAGGLLLGRQLLEMYHLFFRFPQLDFAFDRSALLWALGAGSFAVTVGVWSSVRKAAQLPPAEAMRPEPPSEYRPAIPERLGLAKWLSHSLRIALRNIERRPMQALFTIAGLALATGILIVPNSFRDSVERILRSQWDVVERQDLTLGLVEPDDLRVYFDLLHLPGVVHAEPFRNVAARVRFGHRSRQLAIRGLPENGEHIRTLDASLRLLPLPKEGLLVSAKLGDVLQVRVGDVLEVEVLEGKRPVLRLPIVAMVDDMTGLSAYMEITSLNRKMGEGDVITGASVALDSELRPQFLKRLKDVPRVSWIAIKESLRANFEKTTAASINLIQSIYLVFATTVAFGVVYNNVRISLAERGRELATLRVIGFTQNEVAQVMLTELFLLAVVAVPLGLLLGTGFATGIVGMVNTETVRLPLVLTARNYAFATATIFVASMFSSLVVLRRLDRLDLVGALKAPE